MPTIRKKGDRQWHVQIRKSGYPVQTKTFTTRSDAEKWETIIESEMERGVFVSRTEAEATLLIEVIDRYRREILPFKRGAASDESRLETLVTHFGVYKLASITSTAVAKYRDERLKAVGSQSVIHEINLLNRVLKAATMDWGIALPSGLPTAQVRKPAKPRGRDRRVSQDELNAILEHSESAELATIITLAVETAMRRGELVGLTWTNIDLKTCVAYLPKTKTDSPRSVPLSKTALTALKQLPRNLGKDKVFRLQAESIS